MFLVAGWYKALHGARVIFDQHDIMPELYEAKFGRRDWGYALVRAAHDEDFGGAFAAAREGYVPVRLVRRDHDVGRGERQSLRSAHKSIAPVAPPELRLVELGHDVVLVKDHADAVNNFVPAGDQEEEVGWVADVHHVEGSLVPDAPGEV